jgi:hypothetical protein
MPEIDTILINGLMIQSNFSITMHIYLPLSRWRNFAKISQFLEIVLVIFKSEVCVSVQATLCAGLYPNVAKMDEESIRLGHANAYGRRAGLSSAGKVHWGDGRQEVFIHPSSVNHNVFEFQHPFLVFHEKVVLLY